jgi:hypothetical protein
MLYTIFLVLGVCLRVLSTRHNVRVSGLRLDQEDRDLLVPFWKSCSTLRMPKLHLHPILTLTPGYLPGFGCRFLNSWKRRWWLETSGRDIISAKIPNFCDWGCIGLKTCGSKWELDFMGSSRKGLRPYYRRFITNIGRYKCGHDVFPSRHGSYTYLFSFWKRRVSDFLGLTSIDRRRWVIYFVIMSKYRGAYSSWAPYSNSRKIGIKQFELNVLQQRLSWMWAQSHEKTSMANWKFISVDKHDSIQDGD